MAGVLKQTTRQMAVDYSTESTLDGSQDRGSMSNPRKRKAASQWLRGSKYIRQGRETTEGTNHVAKSSPPMWLDGAVGRERRHITKLKPSVQNITDAHTRFTEDVPFPELSHRPGILLF